jgi:diguanylate cyclase (GGDEF)-like protein
MNELAPSSRRAAERASEAGKVTCPPQAAVFVGACGDASLAGRLRRTFVLIGAMVSFAFVATAIGFLVSSFWLVPDIEHCRRARRAARDLYAAMLNEETGARGYVLARDSHFLEPYNEGELTRARVDDELDAYAAPDSALAAALRRTREAEGRWRERWGRPVAEMAADGIPPAMDEGKRLFDAYRAEQLAFMGAIAIRTDILGRREQQAIGVRVTLELAIFLALLVLAVREHRALREAIVAPVAGLLRDIGRVRDGELVTTIHRSGPSELRELGEGLNDMVRALTTARGIADSRDELLRAHSDRLRQILDASREFSESLNLAYVVRSVCTSTRTVGGYTQVIVWLMDDEQTGLRDASVEQSTLTPNEPVDTALSWRVAKSGRIAFETPEGRIRFGDASAVPLRAIAIPLIVGARVVGALEARHEVPRVTSGEAFEVLEMLATHAATAIESARLNQIAEERSQVDPLTRLNNRRRLEEDLDAECRRCARYGRPLSFIMLDVDHFKAFNDAHGHPQADVALQEIAEVIAGAVRTTDSAYRYGGEEFCVLLRETDAESAMCFAERLRQRIELRFTNATTVGITASVGVAGFSAETPTPRALVEAADAAMYEAKHAGRNRVHLRSSAPPKNVESDPSDSSGTIRIASLPPLGVAPH